MHKRVFLGLLLLLTTASAWSKSTDWQTNTHGRVRFVTPYTTAPEKGTVILGLQFQPIPEWHVYFRDPGDAGFPPKVEWTGTTGIKNAEILFPTPKRYDLPGGLIAIGYDTDVIYPIKATRISGPLHIQAKVSYLTCKESCVPYKYTFTLDLPSAATVELDDLEAGPIEAFLQKVPANERGGLTLGVQPAATAADIPSEKLSFGILLLALLGGLLLNVMPCVLPVLSIKLLGLLQHGGQSRSIVVRDSLASAAGIVVSFMALALVAIGAKQAGRAVGWGIQFQEPIFVGVLVIILVLFALNLWGLFEISLPLWIARLGATSSEDEGPGSFFVSGLFVTILATPCSAPFLGTALGFALAQPPASIAAIFFAAGTGLAMPYLALAVFPQAVRWLPKPGPWMSKLRIFLGFLLAATAVWLGSVLYHQLTKSNRAPADVILAGLPWRPFNEAEIAKYTGEGRSVFVDVTADWCFTCKVNERLVLAEKDVVEALRPHILMRADWTNNDPAISDYLKRNGRAGIPFYAFYQPGKPPVKFSELLRKDQVLEALRQ